VYFTTFTPTRGLAVTHFRRFSNLRIWFADSHSNSVSILRVGQPGFWFPRGAGIVQKIRVFRVMSFRPVNSRSYRRVTPGTADFRNVRNYLPVPQMFVLWFLTPCRVVSLIQHLNVPSPHSVIMQGQVAQFSEVLNKPTIVHGART